MDSKLVIEQMAGRWKIKHPGMRTLALQAQRLAPGGTTWTWVPRAENAAADELVNAVLDGIAPGRRVHGRVSTPTAAGRTWRKRLQMPAAATRAARPAGRVAQRRAR